jgi:hypothetical protein
MSVLPDWLSFDSLKDIVFNPRVLFVICFVGLLLLFLPATYLNYFGLTVFRDEYRKWIGLATLLTIVLLVTQFVSYIWAHMHGKRSARKSIAHRLQSLDTLTRGEWFILQHCLDRSEQTVFLSFGDPHAMSLCNKGLLKPARTGHTWNYPFTIPDFVWSHLQELRPQIIPSDPEQLRAFREFWHVYNETAVYRRQELFSHTEPPSPPPSGLSYRR